MPSTPAPYGFPPGGNGVRDALEFHATDPAGVQASAPCSANSDAALQQLAAGLVPAGAPDTRAWRPAGRLLRRPDGNPWRALK